MSMKTQTDNSGQVIDATVDFKQMAIDKVFKISEEWFEMHDCRNTDRFCENFGCESIDELLEPLRDFRTNK